MNVKEAYDCLGVNENTSDDEIKKSVRKLMAQYHPDRCKDSNAEEKFKRVGEAERVIKDFRDPNKQNPFSRVETTYSSPFDYFSVPFGSGFDFTHDFNEIFNRNRRAAGPEYVYHQARSAPQTFRFDPHVRLTVELGLKESLFGCEKEIIFKRKTLCNKCNGLGAVETTSKCKFCDGSGIKTIRKAVSNMIYEQTLVCDKCKGVGKELKECLECKKEGFTEADAKIRIKFPQGINDSDEAIQKNFGNQIGPSTKGSLIVTVKVKDDEVYRREGNEILQNISVNLIDVLKKNSSDIELVDDTKVQYCLQNVKHKDKIKLKEISLNSGIVLKCYAFVDVEYPDDKTTETMLKNLD